MSSDQRWTVERSQRIASALPVLSFMALVSWGSSIPPAELPDFARFWSDKLLHAIAFLAFGILYQCAAAGSRPWTTSRSLRLSTVTVGAVYGLSIEVVQMLTPGREASGLDLLADLFGLLLALITTRYILGMFQQE